MAGEAQAPIKIAAAKARLAAPVNIVRNRIFLACQEPTLILSSELEVSTACQAAPAAIHILTAHHSAHHRLGRKADKVVADQVVQD